MTNFAGRVDVPGAIVGDLQFAQGFADIWLDDLANLLESQLSSRCWVDRTIEVASAVCRRRNGR